MSIPYGRDYPDPPDIEPDDNEWFWESRDSLRHIRTAARARRVGPWALLGVVMVKAIAVVPTMVKLPPLVGDAASLNLFVGLIGPSGAGKGAAEAAAERVIGFTTDLIPPVLPIGSGEGIAKTFVDKAENTTTAAIFTAGEIDGLFALTARTGSTLNTELRKAFTGEAIGFANAGKDTRVPIKAHTYRMCVLAGVQPLRAGALLAGADGGLPQRFLWLPTADPAAPDTAPASPERRVVKIGKYRPGELKLPASIRDTIDAARVDRLREVATVDPLESHADLLQLKAAAALMLLEGRTDGISEDDWELSGYLMEISRGTRDVCIRALREQSRKMTYAKAASVADRDEIVSERKAQRARQHIVRRLTRCGKQTRGDLYRDARSDIRDYCDSALVDLAETGQILVFAGENDADTYALASTVDGPST